MRYIICDLDGTLANVDHRREYFPDGKLNWKKFHSEIINDSVNKWCELILNKFFFDKDLEIILLSGRSEDYRDVTLEWLKKHNINYHYLFMRKSKDNRKDSIVKEELYEECKKRFTGEVLFVIDDRQQVVDMWRKKGLTCLQCDVGNF
jgi:hypothetical protein